MKIEKVNDHQIRCTLTKADLADRHMKLSELAYGTDKAKSLFKDMMQQASFEFGFEAEDIPLMIEAIPLSGDCIVLIITKVEDPEELDTRFSKFAPGLEDEDSSNEETATGNTSVSADDVLDLFKKLHSELTETANLLASKSKTEAEIEISVPNDICRMYRFSDMESIIRLSHVLKDYYTGVNTLYKLHGESDYYLVVHKTNQDPEDFNKICNIMAEYGVAMRYSKGQDAYMKEHGHVIMMNQALQNLVQIL